MYFELSDEETRLETGAASALASQYSFSSERIDNEDFSGANKREDSLDNRQHSYKRNSINLAQTNSAINFEKTRRTIGHESNPYDAFEGYLAYRKKNENSAKNLPTEQTVVEQVHQIAEEYELQLLGEQVSIRLLSDKEGQAENASTYLQWVTFLDHSTNPNSQDLAGMGEYEASKALLDDKAATENVLSYVEWVRFLAQCTETKIVAQDIYEFEHGHSAFKSTAETYIGDVVLDEIEANSYSTNDLHDDQDEYARSEEEGWFYED